MSALWESIPTCALGCSVEAVALVGDANAPACAEHLLAAVAGAFDLAEPGEVLSVLKI